MYNRGLHVPDSHEENYKTSLQSKLGTNGKHTMMIGRHNVSKMSLLDFFLVIQKRMIRFHWKDHTTNNLENKKEECHCPIRY